MIDHILCYSSDAPDRTAVCWLDELGRTWMPVVCVVSEPIYGPESDLLEAGVYAPGLWFVVRAATLQQDLSEDERCLVVSDSELASAGSPFVLVSKLEPETLLGSISPVFSGDKYPFPSGPASNLDALLVHSAT